MNITEKWNVLLDKMKQLWNSEMAEKPDETSQDTEDHAQEKAPDGDTIPEPQQTELAETAPEPVDPAIRLARLEALASLTNPKEDPSVHEFRNSPNRNAYDEDAKLFR